MLSLLLTLAQPALAEEPEAPEVPVCSFMEPNWGIDGKFVTAGAMTAVKKGDKTLLVTAHHLLGPPIGLPAQLSADDVVGKVKSVGLKDAFTGASCGRSTEAVKVEGAKPMAGGDNSGDLAAFVLFQDTSVNRLTSKDKPVAPRALADAAPEKGDTVFVVSKVPDQDKKVWKAEVVDVSDKALYYSMADTAFTATSGAPVVTPSGALLGLHLGAGTMEDGAVVGTATPWQTLKKHLSE